MLAAARAGTLNPELDARAGGFAAIVGNPPFLGGKRISTVLNQPYERYLKTILTNTKGSADLCVYFFLRACSLMQFNSSSGLLATNTIAQGDTREVGLDAIIREGLTITRAISSRPWPGTAGVEVAHVWIRRGMWKGPYFLDDQRVSGITSLLTESSKAQGNPYRLSGNQGLVFNGVKIYGQGFLLEPIEAQALIEKDARNQDVLFPYLNGEDLNSRPDQCPSRWSINFFDWTIQKSIVCDNLKIDHLATG